MLTRSTLIYIGGAGHSGSSLLDLLLGNHPDISGSGEVHRLSLEPGIRLCSCGVPINQCPHWNEVGKLYAASLGVEYQQFDWSKFSVTKVRTEVHTIPRLHEIALILGSARMLRVLGLISRDVAEYIQMARNSWKLYDALTSYEGSHFVVDSTKNGVRLKLTYLTRPKTFKVVYLVRDGRAIVASSRRRTSMSIRRSAKVWKRENRNVLLTLLTIPAHQKIFVRYEDLCDNPELELTRLCAFLGVDYSEEMLRLGTRVPHSIPGNPMLFKRLKQIVKDERWKSELSENDLCEFERIAGPLNSQLGYDSSTDCNSPVSTVTDFGYRPLLFWITNEA